MSARDVGGTLPFVSIVIPAKNEAQHLPHVLDAVNALDYPVDRREVIVVDNGSTDATAVLAREKGARVIAAPDVKVGEVRNVGVHAGRGEILAFVDADCLVAPAWLSAGVKRLQDDRIGAVGGSCLIASSGHWVERAWVVEEATECEDADSLATSSFMVRRETFEELSGFDASLGAGEDDDLSCRIRAIGLRLFRDPGCAVIHLGYPKTLTGVLRRQIWHGRSQLYTSGFGPMLLLTHAFAVGIFALAPYALLSLNWRLALVALTATLTIAALPSYFKERRMAAFEGIRFFQRVTVYWFFFLGRAIGLVFNYGDLVGRMRQGVLVGGRER